jgi:hypothetical protein
MTFACCGGIQSGNRAGYPVKKSGLGIQDTDNIEKLTYANQLLMTKATSLATAFNYKSKLDFELDYWNDPSFNEIYVDFR